MISWPERDLSFLGEEGGGGGGNLSQSNVILKSGSSYFALLNDPKWPSDVYLIIIIDLV